jgi:hypothetical protein
LYITSPSIEVFKDPVSGQGEILRTYVSAGREVGAGVSVVSVTGVSVPMSFAVGLGEDVLIWSLEGCSVVTIGGEGTHDGDCNISTIR